jgi:hypothetical protein
MTQEDLQTEIEEVMLVPFDLLELEGASESNRAKTAETLLELLGARVRKKRSREFRSGRNNERRGTLGEYGLNRPHYGVSGASLN